MERLEARFAYEVGRAISNIESGAWDGSRYTLTALKNALMEWEEIHEATAYPSSIFTYEELFPERIK